MKEITLDDCKGLINDEKLNESINFVQMNRNKKPNEGMKSLLAIILKSYFLIS